MNSIFLSDSDKEAIVELQRTVRQNSPKIQRQAEEGKD